MDISRRQVLLGGVAAAGSASLGGGVLQKMFERHAAPELASSSDGVLVLVTLYGGNDGLDTVVPYADPAYLSARGELAKRDALPLADGLGLHPSLPKLKRRWDARQVAVVRGVGYPNPNRSHFRSMEIWQSGVPDQAGATGWLGRWLDAQRDDPLLAVAVGATVPLAVRGQRRSAAAIPVTELALPGGDALQRGFASMMKGNGDVARSGRDLVTVAGAAGKLPPPTGTGLAQELGLVANAINGGLPTRVYTVSLDGFDTHAAEQDTHKRLLAELDDALDAFLTAVPSRPVTVLVYSEFGRRVALNGSNGTDHGTAAPVFVVGRRVRGGFHGEQPSLTDLVDGDLKVTTDFRTVYASVLSGVLGAEPSVALPTGTKPLPLF